MGEGFLSSHKRPEPSPIVIPSRLLAKGLQRFGLKASSTLKPLIALCANVSTPPAIAASTMPASISLAALTMARVLDVQAVLMV